MSLIKMGKRDLRKDMTLSILTNFPPRWASMLFMVSTAFLLALSKRERIKVRDVERYPHPNPLPEGKERELINPPRPFQGRGPR
jgi:hypothetical protein